MFFTSIPNMAFKLMIFFLLFLTTIVSVSSRKISTPKNRVIKTIRAKEGGDVVDCIDIYTQPAFNHPALKNHIIQMKSSHLHQTTDQNRTTKNPNSSKLPSQLWLKYGTCPNGTIPIRRRTTNHQTDINDTKVVVTPHHSFSVALTEGFSYSGAKANIKVWHPFVEQAGDYSSSQVMLRSGPLKIFNTAQAGWAVNPAVYNDNNTHFYAYWTVDGMQNTGCFDLTCPGFVQTSRDVLLGAYIGDLYGSEIVIQISLDPYTHNWWLKYNEKEVGYWPGDIFPNMKHQATLVQWGGEVCSPKVGTHPHTATEMAGGKYADPVFESSGTIKGMLIEENSHELKQPEYIFASSDEWDCYDSYLRNDGHREPVFYYGGPGSHNNPRCS